MIAEGIDGVEMRAQLMREFNVAAEQLDAEIARLIAELSARRLVVEG